MVRLALKKTMNSGRHPCLWCTISSNSKRVPRKERCEITPRTLTSLQTDLHCFQMVGRGDMKVAKNYNNVISQYFFHHPGKLCIHHTCIIHYTPLIRFVHQDCTLH